MTQNQYRLADESRHRQRWEHRRHRQWHPNSHYVTLKKKPSTLRPVFIAPPSKATTVKLWSSIRNWDSSGWVQGESDKAQGVLNLNAPALFLWLGSCPCNHATREPPACRHQRRPPPACASPTFSKVSSLPLRHPPSCHTLLYKS
jgi:hypothetical protein